MHIVLVHGAGGTPRSWALVAPLLAERGFTVSVADNPSQSLAEDAARVRALVDTHDGPALLVGHSYGGAVITNAGDHERVVGLVYVAAFAPQENESVDEIVERYPPALIAEFMTRGENDEWIPERSERSRAALAWDVPRELWDLPDEMVRISAAEIFTAPTGHPAWADKPTWYLVATRDQHIRVEAQRDMAARAGAVISETATSHSVASVAPEQVIATIDAALAALRAV